MRYIALAGLVVLILGLGTVNIQHHMNLPERDKYEVVEHSGLFGDTYDITINDEIKGENTVKNIVTVLRSASKRDVINFHLAGMGGQVETVWYLINNIKASKATVNMIVEAPVYSGHAFLAVSGNTLTIAPYAFLMLHTSSAYGLDCSKAKGTDRTVSNVEHCQAMYLMHMKKIEEMINNITLITANEKQLLLTGHDIYIDSKEVTFRLATHKAHEIVPPVVGG